MTKISSRTARLLIIVIAALMVEAISVAQYQQMRNLVDNELTVRARLVTNSISRSARHTLELTEATMRENMWDIRRNLNNPDCTFNAIVRLIDDNPNVVGGCMAFIPDYYPSKGRLFEPYVYKKGDGYVIEQIADIEHDYTNNDAFNKVLETKTAVWSDPYSYENSSVLRLTTYSCPVTDHDGNIVAVCGLDIDLSRLGEIINDHQHYPSSFCVLMTQEGKLVATPPEGRVPLKTVKKTMACLGDKSIKINGRTVIVPVSQMKEPPYWRIAQVYYKEDLYKPLLKIRLWHVLMILAGVLILAFMINRYARGEKKLQDANMAQARISSELSIASNIQTSMLPKSFPPGVFGTLEPAREVGGDIIDSFERDGKLFFCIGDVSGKGVPSAMVMSVIHGLFRMIADHSESPSFILDALNKEGCRANDSNMFVTFFLGIIDLATGQMLYCNAGHDKPMIITCDVAPLNVKPNLPLGIFPDTVYEDQTCNLAPGTDIFLYTDGLTEARNIRREQFGKKRVMEVLERCRQNDLSQNQLVETMRREVNAFVDGAPQSDDLAMIAIRYSRRMNLTLKNDVKEIARLGDFIKSFLSRLHLEPKTAANIRLALEEIVVNAVSYAYPEGTEGEITVEASSDCSKAVFTVTDNGQPFDPTKVESADISVDIENRPIGGLGLLLARKIMDSIEYQRNGSRNVLTLSKNIL
ncbi:MAG: SpoIIE family protein phosphatase [Bacteroidales bacterium]|nr:SpoIIE family protein phosphatase [Bacteroidales bacterium]